MCNNFTFDENKYPCDVCFGQLAFLAICQPLSAYFLKWQHWKSVWLDRRRISFHKDVKWRHLCRNLTPPVMLNLKWVLLCAIFLSELSWSSSHGKNGNCCHLWRCTHFTFMEDKYLLWWWIGCGSWKLNPGSPSTSTRFSKSTSDKLSTWEKPGYPSLADSSPDDAG